LCFLLSGPIPTLTLTLPIKLSPYLRERGFEVITCPEAFSLLVTNGMSFDYLGAVEGMSDIVQDTVMDMQIGLEDGFERVLRARGRPSVLLCDRGLMDGSAYMSSESWGRLLDKRDVVCVSELREGRYNAVFHLVTAAEGAEQFYTLENNAVRTETPDEARRVDHMTRNAWLGHPNLVIFDNSTDFERKMQRVVEETGRSRIHRWTLHPKRNFVGELTREGVSFSFLPSSPSEKKKPNWSVCQLTCRRSRPSFCSGESRISMHFPRMSRVIYSTLKR